LLDKASVEEQWYDPTNAWQWKKIPPPPQQPKVTYTDYWPVATAPAPSKAVFIAAPEPPPQPKASGYKWGVNELPDSWALAAPPAPLPPPPPTPSYEVYSYRMPELVAAVAPVPPPPPRPEAIEPRRPLVIVAPAPPPPPVPLPPPAPLVMEPIYVTPPAAPLPPPPVVNKSEPRRRFTWESPEMYQED
jgi:hypothetical protein